MYAAVLCAAARVPEGKPGEGRRKTARGSLLTSGGLTDGFVVYTKDTPFLYHQAHIVGISAKTLLAGWGQGDNVPLVVILSR